MKKHHYFLLFAIISIASECSRRPKYVSVMTIPGWCDTTQMKPVGRPTKIPEAIPVESLGSVTGIVYQRETGDALAGAVIDLLSLDRNPNLAHSAPSNMTGGFRIDSIVAGKYLMRVRRVGLYADSFAVNVAANRLDTIRVAMRTYRCSGY